MREHYATSICAEECSDMDQHRRRGGLNGSGGLGLPRLWLPMMLPLKRLELIFAAMSQDCWAEFFHAAKPARLSSASLEVKGISDMERNSPLFASSVPFCCTSVSFCPLLWLFWNLDLRTHTPAKGSELLQPSTSSATDPFLSWNNDRCWWGAIFDIHLRVQMHAISNFTKT